MFINNGFEYIGNIDTNYAEQLGRKYRDRYRKLFINDKRL